MVLFVRLEMLGQICNPFGQNGNLDLRRAGIRVVDSILFDDFLLTFNRNRQLFTSFRERVTDVVTRNCLVYHVLAIRARDKPLLLAEENFHRLYNTQISPHAVDLVGGEKRLPHSQQDSLAIKDPQPVPGLEGCGNSGHRDPQ